MKIYFLIFFYLVSYSHAEREHNFADETNLKNSTIQMNHQDSIEYNNLEYLTKQEAIEQYGKPNFIERFVLDDAQGEFRNAISNQFTAKERQSESILIDEVTWEKDDYTWITVWYQIVDEKSMPKAVFSWKKGTEF